MPTFETGYWKIRGLGAPMRMMSVYAGADVDDKQYDFLQKPEGGWDASHWFAVGKPPLFEKNAYANLPYVVDKESGLVITQSTSVYTYLGRKFNLMGKNDAELAATEQTLAQAFDLRNDLMKVVYPFEGVTPDTFPDALKKHMEKTASGHFDKFEGFYGEKLFCAGSEPTAGDFHVWEMIDQHEIMAKAQGLPSLLDSRPKMKAFYERFRALEKLAPYFSSADYKLPMNQKMANIK